MNKDVIYIEPEDDITDIISKIEKSKAKIIALVPPKKAGVFRSIVNIKLIAKSSKAAGKTVVLITMDPSIVKLAAATKLPVAKNLKTAPVIPKMEEVEAEEAAAVEIVGDEEEDEIGEEEIAEEIEETNEEPEEEEEPEEKEEKPVKKEKPAKKKGKRSGKGIISWIKNHRVISIIFGLFLIGVIGFLIWAFAFAPAVDFSIAIKTEPKNFSEGVTLTTNMSEENPSEGILYISEQKYENKQEITFDATGEKNLGEKATGELTVVATVSSKGGSTSVREGDVFTNNGLQFIANNTVPMSYDGGEDMSVCKNVDEDTPIKRFNTEGCKIYATIKVTAANPGSNYNVGATSSGWRTTSGVEVINSSIGGGTDQIIKIVQQSDVEAAKSKLTAEKEEENKAKLYDEIDDKQMVIDVSFNQTTSEATVSPGVDEEVKDGVTPKLTAVTTATVYTVEKSKLEEFIGAKAGLSDEQKIYDIRDMYMESFAQARNGYTGRLKAQYFVGPKITETEVVDKVLGKGIGDAKREISDSYEGVSDITITTSYPWVMSVPNDSNRVSVKFTVKDQNGDEIKKNDTGNTEEQTEEETEE